VDQEPSFAVKHAPVIGAIIGGFFVLQFLGFTLLAVIGIVGLLTAFVVAVAAGFLLGMAVKKSKISQQKMAVQQQKEQKNREKADLQKQMKEIKEKISKLQSEKKDTQDDVALLRKTYLANPDINAFCKKYGEAAAEVLVLYFQRGRADSVEEAIGLYEDEAKDKARIRRAQDEVERSVIAYMNAYSSALKTLGRSREYSYLESSLEKHNANLEKENEELREYMGL